MANAIMTEEFKSNVAEKIHLRKESSDDGYVKIDDLQKALMHIKTGNPQQSAIQSNATIIAESFTNLKKQLVKVETRLEAMEDHLFNLEQRSYDRKKALIQQIVKTAVKKIDKKDTKDVSTQVNFPSREYDTIVILEPPIGDTFIISDGTSSSSSSTLSFEEATLIETDMTLSDCYRAMNKFNKHMLRKSISEGGLV
ncbi:uncharacterized protein Dwil_GK11024 [Drosophila willistoni]|uniref:Uncharacterized protein n=2 Tax=Drosophila willistoni TaxID=7260 RepID=B4N8I7_DROWI|nr:uncharacterized protein Dwil_GK11024 [Drosophila willistoni]